MKTKLDRLLENIDPDITLNDVASRVDHAVNRFVQTEIVICDFKKFEGLMSRFVRHIENEVLNLPPSFTPSVYDWGHCSQILDQEYGDQGYKTAFEMARSGIQGGLYAVLKTIASHLIQEYSKRWISNRVHPFWNALSMTEQFEVIEEYAEKYGHLLPADNVEGSGVLLKMNFTQVLEEHPRMIQRLREAQRI